MLRMNLNQKENERLEDFAHTDGFYINRQTIVLIRFLNNWLIGYF